MFELIQRVFYSLFSFNYDLHLEILNDMKEAKNTCRRATHFFVIDSKMEKKKDQTKIEID